MDNDNLFLNIFNNNHNIMLLIEQSTGNIVKANQAAVDYYGYPMDELLSMGIQDINVLSENQVEDKLLFDTLFFNSPYAVAILTPEHRIVNINDNFSNLFQYKIEDIKGETLGSLVSPLGGEDQVDISIDLINQGKDIKREGMRRRKDGILIDVEILAYPIINNQKIIGICIIYIDITERKSYERELHLFKKVLENNTEGVVITDVNGNINWINNAFCEITGYTIDEVLNKNMNILRSGIHGQAFYEDMWNQLEQEGSWSGEIWNKNKSGGIYSEWLNINSIKFNSMETTHFVGVFKDLTKAKIIDRRLTFLQQKDSLTNFYNRRYFTSMVEEYIRDGEIESFSIAYLDLKRFKDINDVYGHSIGDKLLIQISKRIKMLTDENFILSRFGGDEFVILCKTLHKLEDIEEFGKNLVDNLNKPYMIYSNQINIMVSIGVSRYPEDSKYSEVLIRKSHIAMVNAKEKINEKVYIHSEEISQKKENQFYLHNYLASAITNKEFFINYQPIYDIKENVIIGAEALLRWSNPTLGPISPGDFIPIAEKTGHILTIGEWVLNSVCKQINLWKQKHYRILPIAINISVIQLEQYDFSDVVIDILNRNKIDSSYIELEITESVSKGDIDIIVKNINMLKAFGISISMDDFGTGFSSLGQLDLFELDKLKIDKIFIDDLVNVPKRQSLVRAIIAMANGLNLKVVAEGIETLEQLQYLRKLECAFGQGYHFSKPLSAIDFEKFLNTY